LKNKSFFAQIKVDPELKTIVWPNGADLAPEYIFFRAFKEGQWSEVGSRRSEVRKR